MTISGQTREIGNYREQTGHMLQSFEKYDSVTQEALKHLSPNDEFRELWTNVQHRWGKKLKISTYHPKNLKEIKLPAYTQYDNMSIGEPGSINICINKSSIKSVRAFSLLIELCNVEKMDEYVALDREAANLWPEEYATKREKIEWEVLKKADRISRTFFPRLRYVDDKVVQSFDKYLQLNKENGHFSNYKTLGFYLLCKIRIRSLIPFF